MTVITEEKKYLFYSELMNKKTFVAYRMIESDIKKLELTGFYLDEISPKDVNYYAFKEFSGTVENCKSVDISAAYPNTLLNLGFISENTHSYLMKLKKAQRLKAVGMLATKKVAYFIRNKKLEKIIINENPFSKYFFAVCKAVGDLMNKLYLEYSENVYLFWVDGIFCENKIAEEILNKIKLHYPAKIENIENLKFSESGSYLRYKKDGKLKILPVPRKKTTFNSNIISFVENN